MTSPPHPTLTDRETDPLPALRVRGLLPHNTIPPAAATTTDRVPAAPITHLDPRTPHRVDGAGGVTGLYAQDALVNTEATPPYLRLPSFPAYTPYLLICFADRPPSGQFTAALDLQIYSVGGSIRITATGNPVATILSNTATGGARVRVPIPFTTTEDGLANVLVQRVDQTGFDWFGVDLT